MQTLPITDTKLYVPLVIFSTEDDNKLLQQLKPEFKIIIKWNKYSSEMLNQTKNNNVNYLNDPTFLKARDHSCYHLRVKMMEYPFQNTIH